MAIIATGQGNLLNSIENKTVRDLEGCIFVFFSHYK